MKAPSDIFTTIQKPFTVLGVPFKLFIMEFTLALLIIVLFWTIEFEATGVVLGMATFLTCHIQLIKKTKENCHIEQLFFYGMSFFKRKATRHLIPGIPQRKESKKGRRF